MVTQSFHAYNKVVHNGYQGNIKGRYGELTRREQHKNKQKQKRARRLKVGVASVLTVAVIGSMGVWGYYRNHFKMANINGVNVSGLTIAQATDKLNTAAGNKTNDLVVKGSRVKVDQAQVSELFNNRSSMSMLANPSMTTGVAISKAQQTKRLTVLLPKFKNQVDEINAAKKPTTNTKVNLVDGKVVVKEGTQGTQLDKKWMVKQFKYQAKRDLEISVPKKVLKIDSPSSQAVKDEKQKLQELMNHKVTVKTYNKDLKFKASDYLTNAVQTAPGKYKFDSSKLAARIKQLANKIDTLGKPYKLKVHSGQTRVVQGGTYGWQVNQTALTKNIMKHLQANAKTTMNLKHYAIGRGYGEKNVGKTRVEVDLKNLMEYVYVNGKLKVKTPVMSGTVTGGNKTPQGTFYILYKQRHATLRGKNNDGSKYASPVSYWVPITTDGVGLHDSPWQPASVYGNPSARSQYHSHGCVNNPPSIMGKVFKYTSVNEPVVIYY